MAARVVASAATARNTTAGDTAKSPPTNSMTDPGPEGPLAGTISATYGVCELELLPDCKKPGSKSEVVEVVLGARNAPDELSWLLEQRPNEQKLLRQSLATLQGSLMGQGGHAPPHWPSTQEAATWHTPPAHSPDWQSAADPQRAKAEHNLVTPQAAPQSRSDSVPCCHTPSKHDPAPQVPSGAPTNGKRQSMLLHSPELEHAPPIGVGPHTGPTSTATSPLSLTPLEQVAGLEQVPWSQSESP
jgi:hypothetical protein